jgi:hypothetical protein
VEAIVSTGLFIFGEYEEVRFCHPFNLVIPTIGFLSNWELPASVNCGAILPDPYANFRQIPDTFD